MSLLSLLLQNSRILDLEETLETIQSNLNYTGDRMYTPLYNGDTTKAERDYVNLI